MTREEFNRKAEAGTLTVRDVREHREYVTPELLAVLDAAPDLARIKTATAEIYGRGVRIVEDLNEKEQATVEVAAELWDVIAEGKTTPDR